ncbi:type II toxin-antitoxin system VapC family toxin [Candidatus Gracilibacteria bacterium]|nr:type II toxin-antitoxin system VapC family toxin [Candidatus Gracilibacteria bacterium]
MNGNKIFVDTNIILYLLNGDKTLAELLNGKQIYISFITELELLSYSQNSRKDLKIIKELLNQCVIIDINDEIKELVIELKKKNHFKIPDGIIIATAIYLDLPLITADQDFKKADLLNLIYYER